TSPQANDYGPSGAKKYPHGVAQRGEAAAIGACIAQIGMRPTSSRWGRPPGRAKRDRREGGLKANTGKDSRIATAVLFNQPSFQNPFGLRKATGPGIAP